MSMYDDLITELQLRVTSPDKKITGELHEGSTLTLSFAGDSYQQYTEHELERQLASLARLLVTARRRAQLKALSRAIGYDVTDAGMVRDETGREFRSRRSHITAKGISPNGHCGVKSTGLTEWKVRVKNGTLRRLSPEQFLSEVNGALRAMIIDYRQQVQRIKQDVYHMLRLVGERSVPA